ncbi:hypothetical protein AYO49_03680 [Verrucomicrobiaceae bacterium SCGC AG-212-N21]|nr:hypothetical protein AYO49_03680 [Verrucomicrobiaceae bacterium SCGC AG-212-N21]
MNDDTFTPIDAVKDRLFKLVPAIHQDLDAAQARGSALAPLRSLLRVITEQVTVVEADVDQLYEDWFIETCADWIVPYIGDLVGYTPVPAAGPVGDPDTESGHRLNQALVSRREVANTLRYRRRKGTLALLEELARNVAGWPARAVEPWQMPSFLDVREQHPLDLLDGPFDKHSHTIDVRRVAAPRSHSWHNVNSVALFVWRLRAFSVTRTRAWQVGTSGRRWLFHAVGADQPLFSKPMPEANPNHLAERCNLPAPIKRWELAQRVPDGAGGTRVQASSQFYGLDGSFAIWARDWPHKDAAQPIPPERIIPADLSGWSYEPKPGFVAVDPELGRIIFPPKHPPERKVRVSYHYGFSAAMGGGEYPRRLAQAADAIVYRVAKGGNIDAAYKDWDRRAFPHAVIELEESGIYPTTFRFQIGKSESLQIRAASGERPVLRLVASDVAGADSEEDTDETNDSTAPPDFTVWGEPGSRFTLDGLIIFDQGITVERSADTWPEYGGREHWWPSDAYPCPFDLTIRHCTLVPGWRLEETCHPVWPDEPSLCLRNFPGRVCIQQSILGSIKVEADAVRTDPIPIAICDSIVDATEHRRRRTGGHGDGGSDRPDTVDDHDDPNEHAAEAGHESGCNDLPAIYDSATDFDNWHCSPPAHVLLTVRRSTVFGSFRVHAMALAENSIFTSQVWARRRDAGCFRFSYSPPGSRTPRRFHCQPELAAAAAVEELQAAGITNTDHLDAAREAARQRVVPQFTSKHYGQPGYAQLGQTCASEIARGAEDESEMGAFHDLFQPQREASLRVRLAEYTPANADAGVIFET